jgi:hypothetical protein
MTLMIQSAVKVSLILLVAFGVRASSGTRRAAEKRGAWAVTSSARRPVLLDLPRAVRRQSAVDSEPFVRAPEVREVESAEAGQRHPCVPDDEIILWPAASRAVPNVEVEGLTAPFREHGDRIVEWTRILCAQFEEPRELRFEPRLGPAIDLLPQQRRH